MKVMKDYNYIIKVVGQDMYLKYDGLCTIDKDKAFTTDYVGAEKIINEFNRIYVLRNDSRRFEMAHK